MIEVVSAVAIPIVGLVVWAVRQEGRINTHDKAITGIEDTLKEVKSGQNRILEHIIELSGKVTK